MALLLELRMALARTPLCMVARSYFSLSSQKLVKSLFLASPTLAPPCTVTRSHNYLALCQTRQVARLALRYLCVPLFYYLDLTLKFSFPKCTNNHLIERPRRLQIYVLCLLKPWRHVKVLRIMCSLPSCYRCNYVCIYGPQFVYASYDQLDS